MRMQLIQSTMCIVHAFEVLVSFRGNISIMLICKNKRVDHPCFWTLYSNVVGLIYGFMLISTITTMKFSNFSSMTTITRVEKNKVTHRKVRNLGNLAQIITSTLMHENLMIV
jgi:hypothetical protein